MTETKTRRRGEQLEQAILDAAWSELIDVGYSALTMEGVAARAETSKPVIYRRWPSRAALVLAAWGRQVPAVQPPTDSGTLRSDLVLLFGSIANRVNSMMSEMIAGVMGEAFRDPEVAELLRERLREAPLPNRFSTIVDRAVERGELRPVQLSQRVLRLPVELIRNEGMMGCPITSDVVAELVDEVYLPLLRGLATAP